jgi:type I restriction enzyme S subunit
MSFLRYEKYKDSGVASLGDVPAHWNVRHIKRAATFVYGDALTHESRNEDGPVPVFGSNGSFGRHDQPNTDAPAILIGRKGSCGALNWTDVPAFAIDTVYFVDRRCCHENLRWFWWALHIAGLSDSSQDTGVPGLSREAAHNTKLPVPSPAEQVAIATFLDRETAKIDGLVDEQKRLIDLLKEKRQAVISHAVTKGLNPNAPTKGSGVEWLGEVPAHWEVTAIKRFCEEITDGAHVSPETEKGVFCFVSTKDIGNDSIDFDGCLRTSDESYSLMVRSGCQPRMGDVLFSKDGTIGRTVVVREDRAFVVASSLIIIRPNISVLTSEFLNYLCQSSEVAGQVEGFVKGAGLPRLSIQNLLKIIGVFPSLQEQAAIARFLDVETSKTDALIAEAELAEELLKERRTALISAAVTGKIDVRAKVKQREPAAA